ncbi:MFS transporter [Thomasclavelia spiroformis]|uniref:MFS transporter n=1 Tax=Thomasclavelia spiroformis TaxID=29348 RepID=UPI00399389E1
MKNKLILLSILSVALVSSIRGSIIPGMNLLYQEYSAYPMSTVSLIITIPSIAVIPTSYFCSKFVGTKVSYRTILIAMNAALLFGGTGPFFIDELYSRLFLRLLFGIGIGIAISLNKSIILEYYTDNRQIKYLGYTTIISSLGAIFFQTLVGYLSKISTDFMFLGYLPLVITLILSFYIPDIPLKAPSKSTIKKEKNIKLLTISIFFLILNMLMSSIGINLSTLFATKSFADIAVITVHANNINSICSISSGLLFNKIYNKFKNNFLPISLFLCALSLAIYIFGKSYISMYITSGIFGFTYNTIILYIFLIAAQTAKEKGNAAVGGYMGIAAGIGGFLPSFLVYLCQLFFNECIYSVLFIAVMFLVFVGFITIKFLPAKIKS